MVPSETPRGQKGNKTVQNHTLPRPLSLTSRWTLAGAGLVLLLVGTPIFMDPLAYERGVGVLLPEDPTLLSDLRAMAASILATGLLLLAGANWQRLGPTAAIAGAMLYLSYGLSRLVTMIVDGLPAAALMGATALELVIGSLLAVVALSRRP